MVKLIETPKENDHFLSEFVCIKYEVIKRT